MYRISLPVLLLKQNGRDQVRASLCYLFPLIISSLNLLLAMASLSEPDSISSSNPTRKLHARVSDDSTVARLARKKTESPRCAKQQTEKVKEKFMSADLFCQKMGGMIEKQDVQAILDIQTET